jgi:hypothetical protein
MSISFATHLGEITMSPRETKDMVLGAFSLTIEDARTIKDARRITAETPLRTVRPIAVACQAGAWMTCNFG